MVRNYKRKGGHGGSRLGAGLKAGYWEEQGGRAAAAIAKAEHKQRMAAKAAKDSAAAKECWQKWAAQPPVEPRDTGTEAGQDNAQGLPA